MEGDGLGCSLGMSDVSPPASLSGHFLFPLPSFYPVFNPETIPFFRMLTLQLHVEKSCLLLSNNSFDEVRT